MKPEHIRVGFLVTCLATAFACGAELSPENRRVITNTATIIAVCEDVGQACQEAEDDDPDAGRGSYHCFKKYDECMISGGLRALPDGGKDGSR